MTELKTKKYTYFIGIDISRNELDYAVMHGKKLLFHREAKNEPQDIFAFIDELKLLPGFTISRSVFCMEQTGVYSNHLLNALKRIKANVVLENALQIKNSLGLLRGKYDKIDAIRIAQYAYTNRESLNIKVSQRLTIIQLANLFSIRNRLLGLQLALNLPLTEQASFIKEVIHKESVTACKRSLEALKADLEDVEKSIDALIKSDDHLARLFQIITSVSHVGRITAIQMIICTNEFKDIKDPKKFACYAGVAPFKKESGRFKGRAKVSPLANKKMKSLLHICAISALRGKNELKLYYDRKVAEGKPKMAVINAIRNKIILRVFACINENRLYTQDPITDPKITASGNCLVTEVETYNRNQSFAVLKHKQQEELT